MGEPAGDVAAPRSRSRQGCSHRSGGGDDLPATHAVRFGPLYTRAVLDPFAEQLCATLQLGAGVTACDVMCDSGALTRRLASCIGPGGRVYAVDVDPRCSEAAARGTANA